MEIEELKLWNIETNYIEYLRTIDDKVLKNKPQHHIRPYLGIILKIDDHNYFVPLSSAKETKSVNNTVSIKIKNKKDEVKAYLMFNNMIPVLDSVISEIDIEGFKETDKTYYDLLQVERIFIKQIESKILKKAGNVYKLRIQKNPKPFFVEICNDFKKIELEYRKH